MAAAIIKEAIPANGQVIVFSKVPAGSYCSTGVPYRVMSTRGREVWFQRADGTSGTSDPKWAVKTAVWALVAPQAEAA